MTPPAGVVCPKCQHREGSAANFCSRCGGALRGPPCPACAAPSEAGDRYCTQCGAAFRGTRFPGAGARARLPWAVAGVLALALVVVFVVRGDGGREITLSPPPSASGGALGPTGAVDLASMTPREAANRLYDRVMTAVEAGRQAEAAQFLPMAIASYDRIAALSLDDRFHLSLLHAAAGDGASAVAVAEAGLGVRPTHLLCLAAAAEGALAMEDRDKVATYYQTLLDVYDEEMLAGLMEYGPRDAGGHADLLPVLREEATAYLSASR